MKIRSRVLIALLGGSGLLLGGLAIALDRFTSEHLSEMSWLRMNAQVSGLESLAYVSYSNQIERLDRAVHWIEAEAADRLRVGKRQTTLSVTDQTNQERMEVQLPEVSIDGKAGTSLTDAMVDSISQRFGIEATVLVLSSKGLVRITTTVRDSAGNRAKGSMIPASSPVVDSIRAGKGYRGVATVMGKAFAVRYMPFRSPDGSVAGALFCGLPEIDYERIKPAFTQQKSSATSYAFAFNQKGVLRIHPSLEGKDLSSKDFVREMLDRDSGNIRYQFADAKTGKLIWKRATFRTVAGLDWLVGVTDNEGTILEVARDVRWFLIVAMMLGAVGFVGLAIAIDRTISKPLTAAVVSLEEVASGDGDLRRRLVQDQRDEIGWLGRAFNRFADSIAKLVVEVKGKTGSLLDSSRQLEQSASSLDQVASESSRMSNALKSATEKLQDGAIKVSVAMEQSSSNLLSLSSAVEQMHASIGEIAQSASRSRSTGAEALQAADAAAQDLSRLAEASKEIESIVYLIGEISEQTRLLSLNATIEAARAGEAGRGFAVVATEVKELAGGVQRASEEISEKVARMREVSEISGRKILRIAEIMGAVSGDQGGIAASVEEQTATVREIASQIGQVGAAVKEASRGGGEVASTARLVAEEVRKLEEVSGALKVQVDVVGRESSQIQDKARELGEVVSRFRT
ncbi:MAG: Cache 3/Cache 2 fusion domain-containing protein [Fibrobacterota bacterium]|nr:Cache 3/Cache 2 fusion domain-containing protein [Fibrobacterota bacterium]QQS03712.1 MAG: Cache 3/Cache 2 fusion domain-containing protein [Fibrobacterota bacterium]